MSSESTKSGVWIDTFNPSLCYGFASKTYETPPGAMSCATVDEAVKASNDAAAKLIETENEYLLSMGFKIVVDHRKETVAWEVPSGTNFTSGYAMSRKSALDLARSLEGQSKARAEREIKRLKEKHEIDG